MHKFWENVYRPKGLTEYNPFLLKNMENALERMVKAINEREKIVVYGCCNVDGICGISLLLLVLKYLNADVEYYISDNINDGDKLNTEAIRNHIKFLGANLIITVGCEFESMEQKNLCNDLGIDVLITHNKDHILSFGSIAISPRNKKDDYNHKYLSYSGVVFKLAQAIATYYNMKSINKYIDLVMLGTFASELPVEGENELIFKEGMRFLPNTNNYGLRALMRHINVLEITEKDIENIVLTITPTINAIGRMDNARIAVELLTTTNEYRAEQIAKYLDKEVKNSML